MSPDLQSYCDVLTLEREEKRLYLPARMIETAGWPTKGDSVDIVLELREEGRLRMFCYEHVREVLAERRAQLVVESQKDPTNFEKREAVLQLDDRYPHAAYNAKSRRVTFGAVIMVHIDPYPDRKLDIFVQAASGLIDVMSLELRRARLAKSGWSLAPSS